MYIRRTVGKSENGFLIDGRRGWNAPRRTQNDNLNVTRDYVPSLFGGSPFAEDMGDVLIILVTEVLHDFGVLQQG